jgi:hypothetical protein
MEGLDVDTQNAVTRTGEKSSESTGSRKQTPSVGKPSEGVVKLLIHLLQENNQDIDMVAFSEKAQEEGMSISEELQDELELPDGCETFSWEDLFELELSDYEYVGYPPRDRGGDSVTYKEGWNSSNFTGDLTGDTFTVLNGHYADEIQDAFVDDENAGEDDPQAEIAIRVANKKHYDDNFEEARKHQRFYVRSTDATHDRVLKQRLQAGDITESEYEEMTDEEDDEDEEE